MPSLQSRLQRAAELIAGADSLIITAGAGMGVDSGLPDFRGPNGFWNAYPALGRAKLQFEEIANPSAFRRWPRLAWGFYGHRLQLYRDTTPGPAYSILLDLAAHLAHGAFVFTSNVDGHFQKAGFDPERMFECHGSIHYLQCLDQCREVVWGAETLAPEVDTDSCLLRSDVPSCRWCGGIARPNILMFGDDDWISLRTEQQWQRYAEWRQGVERPVVIEIGAGSAIPTVRRFSEGQHCPVIRINTTEAEVSRKADVSLPMPGTEAMCAIAAARITNFS